MTDDWTTRSGSSPQPAGDFIQREPSFGAPSTERTEFKILYDDRKIYFGVWAYDSDPDGIMASELKRDSGLQKGDQIKIIIDTFHDHRNAFYFCTNPLGAYKDSYVGRQRPHGELRLERGVGVQDQQSTSRGGTSRSRFRSASCGSRRVPPRRCGA